MAFSKVPMIERALFLVLPLACSVLAASIDVVGTVTDATTDVPLPKVRIFGPDSSFLDATDAQGRFILKLPRPQEVLFRKEGYKDRVVALSELGNLLDVQVDLDPLGTTLETGVVTGQGTRRRVQAGTIASIEEISGMRFDLQEHLRTLPGVGGTREFSSEISVYGSRTADVTHILGPFAIPNMRHLDYSFPGNQSVLNPRVLQSVTVEHDPVSGPLEQGLASALRYVPRRASADKYEAVVSLGLTNRELDLMAPIGNGGVVVSGRWLDPSLLSHLGDRFFAGSSNSSTADRLEDKSTDPLSKLDLTAMDGYMRVEQGVGNFSLAATAMGAFDQYKVKLQTSSYDQDGNLRADEYVPITQGDRSDWVVFTDLQGDLDAGYLQLYSGVVGRDESQLLSDTVFYGGAQGLDPTSPVYKSWVNPEDWAAWTKSSRDYRGGGMFRLGAPVLGAETEFLAAADYISEDRAQGRTFTGAVGTGIADERSITNLDGHPAAIKRTTEWVRSRGAGRMRWKIDDAQYGLAVGGLWADGPGWNSEFTGSAMQPAFGVGWVGNVSMRAQERTEAKTVGEMEVVTTSGLETKLGGGKRLGPFEMTGAVYWRSLTDPALPACDFWWAYPFKNKADEAQVLGGNFQTRFDGWRRVKALVNLSRVEGEYTLDDGSTLEWDANRDLDVLTEIKMHPMDDTLFSVIVTHIASFGKPQYVYDLDTAARAIDVRGDPRVEGGARRRDAFRTDVRIELDMPVRISPIQGMRLYIEGQNLFSEFTGDWARPLGGGNFRARGMEAVRTRANSNSRYQVVGAEPLYARGTDLFVSFGIEGSLGI